MGIQSKPIESNKNQKSIFEITTEAGDKSCLAIIN